MKVLDLILHNLNPFGLQAQFHGVGPVKMVFATQQANAIDHPMCGNICLNMTGVHGPTHHSGALFGAQVIGNSAITRDATTWNEPHDVVDILEEIFVFEHFQR